MPTYRNDTDKRITHADMNYMYWSPGEEKSLPFFVPHGKLGLTLTSDYPAADNLVFDWTVTLAPFEPETLELPYFEAFELSIRTVAGSAEVRIGNSDTAIGVTSEEIHVSTYTYARCPRLRFVSKTDAMLHVKIEERNTKNTLRRGDV
jgi:hypothetical protein